MSDDSIFHVANANCLIENSNLHASSPELYKKFADYYIDAIENDMKGFEKKIIFILKFYSFIKKLLNFDKKKNSLNIGLNFMLQKTLI